MCLNDKIASIANNSWVKNEALDWWDLLILRKRVKTNSKIKQQTLSTSKKEQIDNKQKIN